MTPAMAVVDALAQTAPSGAAPPFSVLQLGKALVTLSLCSIVTAALMARVALQLRRRSPEHPAPPRSAVDLCLVWGALTFGAGLFHMFMSLVSTTSSVQLFGPIGPDQQWLVARGLMLAFIAGAWGLLVLLLTALGWLGLRRWHRNAAPVVA